jgi:hypothetical protein
LEVSRFADYQAVKISWNNKDLLICKVTALVDIRYATLPQRLIEEYAARIYLCVQSMISRLFLRLIKILLGIIDQ